MNSIKKLRNRLDAIELSLAQSRAIVDELEREWNETIGQPAFVLDDDVLDKVCDGLARDIGMPQLVAVPGECMEEMRRRVSR